MLHCQNTAQAATFMQQVERLVDVGQVHAVGNVLVHLDFLQIAVENYVRVIQKTHQGLIWQVLSVV